MDPLTADVAWERLGAAAQLLHHAALEVWSGADDQDPDSPLHSLGLGVYLAEAQAERAAPRRPQGPRPRHRPRRARDPAAPDLGPRN